MTSALVSGLRASCSMVLFPLQHRGLSLTVSGLELKRIRRTPEVRRASTKDTGFQRLGSLLLPEFNATLRWSPCSSALLVRPRGAQSCSVGKYHTEP